MKSEVYVGWWSPTKQSEPREICWHTDYATCWAMVRDATPRVGQRTVLPAGVTPKPKAQR